MTAATATVKGGFWPQYGSTFTSIQGRATGTRRVAQLLGRRGMMATRELLETLNGAAAGSAASKTLSRITNSTELGGKRTVETQTILSRNTASGDVTEINAHLLAFSTKTTMASPANKDGNPLGFR